MIVVVRLMTTVLAIRRRSTPFVLPVGYLRRKANRTNNNNNDNNLSRGCRERNIK